LAKQSHRAFWQNKPNLDFGRTNANRIWPSKANQVLAEQSQPRKSRLASFLQIPSVALFRQNFIGGFVPPKLRRRTVRRRFGVSGSD
jgi:hypothetical protein